MNPVEFLIVAASYTLLRLGHVCRRAGQGRRLSAVARGRTVRRRGRQLIVRILSKALQGVPYGAAPIGTVVKIDSTGLLCVDFGGRRVAWFRADEVTV